MMSHRTNVPPEQECGKAFNDCNALPSTAKAFLQYTTEQNEPGHFLGFNIRGPMVELHAFTKSRETGLGNFPA